MHVQMLRWPFLRASALGLEVGPRIQIPWDAAAGLVKVQSRGTWWYVCLRQGADGVVFQRWRRLFLGSTVPLPLLFLSRVDQGRVLAEIRRFLDHWEP